ncbi:unnamed protein product [Closterium sp. NIES-54]
MTKTSQHPLRISAAMDSPFSKQCRDLGIRLPKKRSRADYWSRQSAEKAGAAVSEHTKELIRQQEILLQHAMSAERYRQRCEASLGELIKRQVVLVDEGVEAVISEPPVVGVQGDLPLSSTPKGEEEEKSVGVVGSAEIETRRRAEGEEAGERDEPECALKEQATLPVEDGELLVAHSSPVRSNTPTNVATHCATVLSDDDDALLQAALAIPPPARHQLPRTPLPQATVPAGEAADPCQAVAVDKAVEGDMSVRLDLDLATVQASRSARIQQDEVDARVLAVGGGEHSPEERCGDAGSPGAEDWRRVAREAAKQRRLVEGEKRRAVAVAEDVRKENEKLRSMLRCFEHTVVDEVSMTA